MWMSMFIIAISWKLRGSQRRHIEQPACTASGVAELYNSYATVDASIMQALQAIGGATQSRSIHVHPRGQQNNVYTAAFPGKGQNHSLKGVNFKVELRYIAVTPSFDSEIQGRLSLSNPSKPKDHTHNISVLLTKAELQRRVAMPCFRTETRDVNQCMYMLLYRPHDSLQIECLGERTEVTPSTVCSACWTCGDLGM